MVCIYQADIWCEACGRDIARALAAEGRLPAYWSAAEQETLRDDPTEPPEEPFDSGDWPSMGHPEEPTDSPQHCAAGADCLTPIDLRTFGFDPTTQPAQYAEIFRIGALLGGELTEYGVRYLREMLDEPNPTPYQRALHAFWREAFSDYLS